MKADILDKIQPYIDEYCKAKNEYDVCIKNFVEGYGNYSNANTLITSKALMDACEKAIVEILIEENQLPTNPLI